MGFILIQKICVCIYVSMWVCACECSCPQCPEEGNLSPGVGVNRQL